MTGVYMAADKKFQGLFFAPAATNKKGYLKRQMVAVWDIPDCYTDGRNWNHLKSNWLPGRNRKVTVWLPLTGGSRVNSRSV